MRSLRVQKSWVWGVFCLVLLAVGAVGSPAMAQGEAEGPGEAAKVFKWAHESDVQTMEPYGLNESFTLGFLSNIYEGLVRRGPDLTLEPALAERWEIVSSPPVRWRFYLRRGVTFHNGNPFTADDVVFSAERVRHPHSDLRTRLTSDIQVIKIDDHTVDFITEDPNPILPSDWDTWFIMDKEWAEKNGTIRPTRVAGEEEGYAVRHTNGTGPFRLVERVAGEKTILEPFEEWWDTRTHNLDRVDFRPIGNDATRVAALLSGEVDMMYPVPVQDINRIQSGVKTSVLTGPELRTIFLGMDQHRDELLFSDVVGRNPFKDVRVRQAVYHAINIEAIRRKIMRSLSQPAALMIAPQLFAHSDRFLRLPYDPDRARSLLAEAGYGDGFGVTLDCPNNRYINDEQICQAVVSMLAKVGIRVTLRAQPKSKFFAQILAPDYNTSFYLLGWTPGSLDSWNVLYNLLNCRDLDSGKAMFNMGGYCNETIDSLTQDILTETDKAIRDDLIAEAFTLAAEEVAYIPLHQQGLAWGVWDHVSLVQRADNDMVLRHVVLGQRP